MITRQPHQRERDGVPSNASLLVRLFASQLESLIQPSQLKADKNRILGCWRL